MEHLPVFKALCGNNPQHNAGMTHASNPEHLLIFKAPHGDDMEQNVRTIHASNPEHLLVLKALLGNDLFFFSESPFTMGIQRILSIILGHIMAG